jgi:DNA-binding NtrC family response regulator
MQAEIVAPHLHVAAIEGEPGTGKQTLARYLHTRSRASDRAFQRRDAGEWLVTESNPSASTGFLYVDRVDLLAPPGQSLLLAVLKSLQHRPQGPLILVASSENSLRQMAAQGLLLPDLAFRLTAVRFVTPQLRLRPEDIAPLAQALLDRICERYQQRSVVLGPGAMARLLQHNWPGNVRKLSCVLESSLLGTVNGVIRAEDLQLPSPSDTRVAPQPASPTDPLRLDEVITRHVRYILDLNRGNKLRSARQLGISRSTLYRILANQSILSH